jgi:hypothetical protein
MQEFTFILGQNVDLSLEFLNSLQGAWGSDDLTTTELLAFNATKESAHVITGLATVELLVEHLYYTASARNR